MARHHFVRFFAVLLFLASLLCGAIGYAQTQQPKTPRQANSADTTTVANQVQNQIEKPARGKMRAYTARMRRAAAERNKARQQAAPRLQSAPRNQGTKQ